jgi:LuxR family transcriptional regulator of csgAB operon
VNKTAQNKRGLFAVASRSFVIVGRPSLQNTLFAGVLERQLGGRCKVGSVTETTAELATSGTIALLDAGAAPDGELEANLDILCREESIAAVAIFNAETDISVERLLHRPKLKGLFHRETSEEKLVKGLQAILNGEIWLPRKMLADYLELTRGQHRLRAIEVVDLTRMEMETLRAMVGGASNADIANSLNVSPHTVKSHVYNLFRKIKVSNRVQAVSWALTNLEQRQGTLQ